MRLPDLRQKMKAKGRNVATVIVWTIAGAALGSLGGSIFGLMCGALLGVMNGQLGIAFSIVINGLIAGAVAGAMTGMVAKSVDGDWSPQQQLPSVEEIPGHADLHFAARPRFELHDYDSSLSRRL